MIEKWALLADEVIGVDILPGSPTFNYRMLLAFDQTAFNTACDIKREGLRLKLRCYIVGEPQNVTSFTAPYKITQIVDCRVIEPKLDPMIKFHPSDFDRNEKIGDFEILDYIQRWKLSSRYVPDFDLLDAIDGWSCNTGYTRELNSSGVPILMPKCPR